METKDSGMEKIERMFAEITKKLTTMEEKLESSIKEIKSVVIENEWLKKNIKRA